MALKWSAAGKFSSQLISWTITFAVIRILSPEDYGLLAIATIFTSLLMMMGEAGMQAVVIRSESLELGHLKRIFGVIFAGHSLVSTIILLIAPLVAAFYTEPRVTPIMLVLAAHNMVICYTEMPNALLRREMRFRELAFIEITGVIVQSLTSLGLALAGYGVWALVVAQLVAGLVRAVLLNIMRPFLHAPSFHIGAMRDELHFGGYILLQRLLWWAHESFDRALLGKLLGPVQLGYYTVGNELASMPRDKLAKIINQIVFPAVARIKDDRALARTHMLKALEIMSLVIFPIFFGMSAIAADIVTVILGSKWLPALIPLTLLPLAMPFRVLSIPLAQMVNALGYPKVIFRYQITALILTLASLSMGAIWGIIGISVAWVVVSPLNIMIFLYYTHDISGIGFKNLLKTIKIPILISFFMFILIKYFDTSIYAINFINSTLKLYMDGEIIYILHLLYNIILGAFFYIVSSLIFNIHIVRTLISFIKGR